MYKDLLFFYMYRFFYSFLSFIIIYQSIDIPVIGRRLYTGTKVTVVIPIYKGKSVDKQIKQIVKVQIRILCADGSETISSVYFLVSSKLFSKRIIYATNDGYIFFCLLPFNIFSYFLFFNIAKFVIRYCDEVAFFILMNPLF